MATVGPIYTAHLTYPIATPSDIRDEIRRATIESRTPMVLRTEPPMLSPFGVPINPTNPEAGVPPSELPMVQPVQSPLTPTTTAAVRFFQKPIVRGVMIGGAAALAGVGLAYVIFR